MCARSSHERASVVSGCTLALTAALFVWACVDSPTDAEVSETEFWRIELEQLDDGGTGKYPRRGTITLELDLNHTTQPDPTCVDHPHGEDVTTFLASVQALPSRLQDPTTGSANGSWNCHGMVATVQLDDGTQYTLRSDNTIILGFSYGLAFWDPANSRWSSGQRAGAFVFSPREHFPEGARESHVDVLVQNHSSDDWDIALREPNSIADPLTINYGAPPNNVTPVWEHAPASGTAHVTWPAHTFRRWTLDDADRGLERYVAELIPSGQTGQGVEYSCLLAPDHGNQLELIIDANGELQCGQGWVGRAYLAAARSNLYMWAYGGPMRDTVSIIHEGFPNGISVWQTSDPSVTGTLYQAPGVSTLVVDVAASAPRNVHTVEIVGLVPTGQALQFLTFEDRISIWVYELEVTASPDALVIPAGSSDSTEIQVLRVGFLPSNNVLLTLPSPPPGVIATFDPEIVALTSTLRLEVAGTVAPGTYDLTICGASMDDPRQPCIAEPLTLVVTPPPPPSTITGRVYVTSLGLSNVTVRLSANNADIATTSTNSNGNYTFSNLAAGQYTVTISGFPNYAAFASPSQSVTISAGQTRTVDFAGTYVGIEQ